MRLIFLLACAPVALANSGAANCPCLTTFPAGVNPYDGVTIGGAKYGYPSTYGLYTCLRHDSGLPPVCDASSNRPEWCADTWCYIDVANCVLPTTSSSYFPGTTLHYSYSTCGSANTFTLWFGAPDEEPGSGGLGSGPAAPSMPPHVVGDIVTVIHDYLISLSATLEDNEPELRDFREPCAAPAPTSCPCATCEDDTEEAVFWTNSSMTLATWNASGTATSKPYAFDFSAVSLTAKPSLSTTSADGIMERCLSGYLENAFLRVAAREADIDARVGYEYAAFQALGNYVQWPATQWCTQTYDPRFRSWYVSAASGPKDVVIVLDVSGSMRCCDRMPMMIRAASKLLQTLTEQDYVAILRFSSATTAALGRTTLMQATPANVAALTAWVRALEHGGTTNFNAALDTAFRLFDKSRDTTSGCTKALLFLSDGNPDDPPDYAVLQKRAADAGGVQLFTYALGDRADPAVLKRMACMNGGAFWKVPDGGDKLSDAMADYFTFLAPLQQSCQVRWTQYNDINTGAPLLAACLATFKKERRGDASSCAGGNAGCMPELLGVACMDVSLIATMEQINGRADAQSFHDRVRSDQRACNRVDATPEQLQALRARIHPDYGDATCSAADMGTASAAVAQSCVAAGNGSGTASSDAPSADDDEEGEGGGASSALVVFIAVSATVALLVAFVAWRRRSRRRSLPTHGVPTQQNHRAAPRNVSAFPQQAPPMAVATGHPVQPPVVQAQLVQPVYGGGVQMQEGIPMGRPVAVA